VVSRSSAFARKSSVLLRRSEPTLQSTAQQGVVQSLRHGIYAKAILVFRNQLYQPVKGLNRAGTSCALATRISTSPESSSRI